MEHHLIIKWLDLFRVELCELLVDNQEYWDTFKDLLRHDRLKYFDERANSVEVGENDENLDVLKAISKELWDEILATPNKSNLFIKVCEFVKKANSDFCTLINHEGVSKSRISRFLSISIKIHPFINLTKSLEYLSTYSAKMSNILQPISRRLNNNEIDEEIAKCLLLRNIPFFGQSGVEHLMFTVWNFGGVEGKVEVEKIEPRFSQLYDHILSVESRIKRVIVPSCMKVNTALDILAETKTDPLDTISIPNICKLAGLLDCGKEVPLKLRSYQKELAEYAIDGENVLICAPTGSGKTLISVHIVRERYYFSLEHGLNFKVVFLVPTRILVDQQASVLQKFFGQRLKIEKLAGSDSQPQLSLIKAADIIVITPQLLVNVLCYQTVGEDEQIKIEEFSLIIFDECHRANEKHPYNGILKMYHDTKASRKVQMPQIIGLTASVGVGEAKELRASIAYAAKICANLDATKINHVRKNRPELLVHTPIVPDIIEQYDSENNGFFSILENLKISLETDLLGLFKDNEPQKNFCKELKESLHFGKLDEDIYCSIKNLSVRLDKLKNVEEFVRQMSKQILGHMITVNNSARCVRLFGKDAALKTFEECEAQNSAEKLNVYTIQMREALFTLKQQPDFKSPLLSRLIVLINELFASNPNSRCLVFTPTRGYCVELASLISKYSGKKADFLTGNTSAEKNGLNEAKQRSTLNDFRSGSTPILCCTSIADEGLDISECNMVVKYNYVTNAIAHVQRRGRGRHADTKSILLAESDLVKRQEEMNKIKEKLMNDTLNYIDLDIPGFLTQVSLQIDDNKDQRDCERLRQEERTTVLVNDRVYVMVCRKCDQFIARSTDIFQSHSHYLVADPKIWNRVGVNPLSVVDRPSSDSPAIGKIYCKNRSIVQGGICNSKIGSVIISKLGKGCLLPIFTCKEVAFIKTDPDFAGNDTPQGDRSAYNQWKKVIVDLFNPPEVGQYELSVMLQAQPQCSFNAEVNEITARFQA